MERYKELYFHAREVLNAEKDRYYAIEQKASQYFTVLTLILGLASLFIKWILGNSYPPNRTSEFILFVLVVLSWLSLLIAWFIIFSILRVVDLKTLTIDDETIRFYDEHKDIDVYFHMARQMKYSFENNKKEVDRKAARLKLGYWFIMGAVLLLTLFSLTFFLSKHV